MHRRQILTFLWEQLSPDVIAMEHRISLLFPPLPNQVGLCQLGGVKVPDNVNKAGDISSGQRLYSWRDYCGRAYFGDQAFFECFFEWLWC